MGMIITLKAKGPNLSAQMSGAEVTELQTQRGPWRWWGNRSPERGAYLPVDTVVANLIMTIILIIVANVYRMFPMHCTECFVYITSLDPHKTPVVDPLLLFP